MKVLLFSQVMYGGAWRRNYNVLKTMREVDRKIDYVLLLEASNVKLVPNINEVIAELKELYDVKFVKLPLRALYRFTPLHYTYVSKLGETFYEIAKKEKADLIYVPHEVDWWILAAKNASKGTLPWTSLFHSMPLFVCLSTPSPRGAISTLLEAPSLAYKRFKTARGLYRYFRLQWLINALEKTLSLSVSESITRDLKTFYPWLTIRTLTPGVGIDLSYMSSIPASPDNFDAIYFTSELIPHKGFLELPMIWKRVVQSIPEARLLVVGRAQKRYQEQFSDLLEKFDLKKNIILCDLLPHDELISLVKSSTVTIYPSRFDAFPLVVMESLASGVPVVAYDIPAVRLNYVTNSVVKCSVNDVECMATNVVNILSDDNLRKNLSQEATKYAANFSWENVAKEEAKGYLKVLDFWSSK